VFPSSSWQRQIVAVAFPHSQTNFAAITLNAPPLVLLRPEGAWDAPGVLDESVAREPLARSA
jgi:hypothetical protein